MVGNKDTQQRKSCKARTSQDMGILRHVKNFVLCCVSHSRIDTLITMIMSDPCDIVVLSSQPIRSQGLKALDQWAAKTAVASSGCNHHLPLQPAVSGQQSLGG